MISSSKSRYQPKGGRLMTRKLTTVSGFCALLDRPKPRHAGVSLVGAIAYPLSVSGRTSAQHSQKRFTMAGTDFDGWPLGPSEGTSG
jgi:hypothetical protein